MRFVADENVSRALVERLRKRGHDVRWIHGPMSGLDDTGIVGLAERERRVILTHDKGFSRLAFLGALSERIGVVLLRRLARNAGEAADVAKEIERPKALPGRVTVIGKRGVRSRRYPPTSA